MSQTQQQGMSSVRLGNDLKARLIKIGARLSLNDGKARSMEDIIEIILEEYEENHKSDK